MAKKMTFDELKNKISPPMLALLDEFVAGYIAQRQGITLEQARAAIDEKADVRASYQRKMARAAVALVGVAGFQMAKVQHTPKAPTASAPAMPDVSAMLANIAGKANPGAAA